MNKKQFLQELEKRLKVLNEIERKDIVNEYSDIINEKVKNGISEEQAVLEFGNIDELVKEILVSYKINPDYDNNFSKKAKEVANNTEDFIKRGAKKLADTTQNVVNDFKNSGNNLTLETIFEIIIKVFIFLVILGIIKLPFYLLKDLGKSIFGDIFSPLGLGFNVVWNIIIWILYIICACLVGIVFFKDYFDNLKVGNCNTTTSNENENIQSEKTKDNNKPEVFSQPINKTIDKQNNILEILLKIIAIIFIMVPIGSAMVGLYTSTGVCVYLLIEGLPLIGVCIVLLGLSLGANWLFDICHRLIFTKKKIHIVMLFVSIILTIVGGVIFTSEVLNFKFHDETPDVNLSNYTKTLEIDNNLYIYDMYDENIIIDDDIPDNTAIVSIDYYDDLAEVKLHILDKGSTTLSLNADIESPNNLKEMFEIVIDNLKNNNIYNYEYLFKGKVTVKVNSNTKDKIVIRN